MTDRVRLLLLIPHLGGGGAERVIACVAANLDPAIFEVHLALIADDFPGAPTLPAWVNVHRLRVQRVRRAAWPLLQLIRNLRPTILLSGMVHLNSLALLLEPLLPAQTTLLIRHNTTASLAIPGKLHRLIFTWLHRRAHRILCQSEAMAEDLATNFHLDRKRMIVVPNPIDIAVLRRQSLAQHAALATPASLPWRTASFRLIAIGRLSDEKGHDLLLNAFAQALAKHPAAQLAILGDGSRRPSLLALRNQLRIEDSVLFPGFQDDVAPWLSTADLFVQPSRIEGMPNALLEAAASGLPLVATPSSDGLVHMLRHAPGTWLAQDISADALAAAMLAAMDTLRQQPRYEHDFLRPFDLPLAIAAWQRALLKSPNMPVRKDSCQQPAIARRASVKRIALLIPTLAQIGGAERQVILLAQGLAARGWRVTVVALSGQVSDSLSSQFAAAEIEFLALEMRKAWIDPRGWLRFLRWCRLERPAILHAHLPHAAWFARCFRLVHRVPVVLDTLHSTRIGSPRAQWLYRLTSPFADHVTAVSRAGADAALAAKIVSAHKLSVVPNGIPIPDLPAIKSAIKSPIKSEIKSEIPPTFLWLAAGRLAPVKDYPTLLRAFALLPSNPQLEADPLEARLEIAGDGPQRPSLEALAEELGIASRVRWLGFCVDMAPLYARANAVVLASLWEGLPMCTLEAAAYSLPVVATRAQGTTETILEAESGFLAPIGDARALSDAMASVMAMTEDARNRMGIAGRSFIARNYAIEPVLNTWEELYQRLLRQRVHSASS